MSLGERTEVLVVGAGPVGLLGAILLAEAGLEVEVIDSEARTAARSYACALHPRTLRLLGRLGLASPLIALGRQVSKVVFYEGDVRRAEASLADLDSEFPFLLILPQNAFEGALEGRLRQLGVQVRWNHRLEGLQQEESGVVAEVEQLGGTMTGFTVPHWETVVKKKRKVQAQFVVGADGCHSKVRRCLGVPMERTGPPAFFAAYEFEPAADPVLDNEVRVVLEGATTNVLWPLLQGRYRWTFQMLKPGRSEEFPVKERRAVSVARPEVDEQIRAYVERIAKSRAPWFQAGVQQVLWCTEVVFTPQCARDFGQGRCWLAGDAAHQTGPVGVQSMNVGLLEAESLSDVLRRILRLDAPLSLLETYGRDCLATWRDLLGPTSAFKPGSEAGLWFDEHWSRLLPCLPSSGADLARLAGQLCVECPRSRPAAVAAKLGFPVRH